MVRVAFDPGATEFVITADETNTPLRKLKCWLVGSDGKSHEAMLDWDKEGHTWTGWASGPMRDFVTLRIVQMPTEHEIASISLK
jgi:hypothetical protein